MSEKCAGWKVHALSINLEGRIPVFWVGFSLGKTAPGLVICDEQTASRPPFVRSKGREMAGFSQRKTTKKTGMRPPFPLAQKRTLCNK